MIRIMGLIFLGMSSAAFAQPGQNSAMPPQSAQQNSIDPQRAIPPESDPTALVENPMQMAPGVPGENQGNMPPPAPPDEIMAKPAEGLSARDPFRLPEELIIKLRQKFATTINTSNGGSGIDQTVDAIRRYSLTSYQLVGIIWDVKKPKALFKDVEGRIHVTLINDFIGNAKGVITSIQSGAVTVLEGKIPQIIKLKK